MICNLFAALPGADEIQQTMVLFRLRFLMRIWDFPCWFPSP